MKRFVLILISMAIMLAFFASDITTNYGWAVFLKVLGLVLVDWYAYYKYKK